MEPPLIPFVKQRAGDSLRAVVEYEQFDFELLYHRDDLSREELTTRVDTIHQSIQWAWEPDEDDVVDELGEKRATLQVRENAVIIQLSGGPSRGYLIGLEPEAAVDLVTFIGGCLDHTE